MTLGEIASLAGVLTLALALFVEVRQAGVERGRMKAVDDQQQRDIDKLLLSRDQLLGVTATVEGLDARMVRIEGKLDRALELWGQRELPRGGN